MVDYSKWDKVWVSSSEDETPGASCASRKHVLPATSSSHRNSCSSNCTSGGFDYSKWDHLVDEEQESFSSPRVRRLSKGQAVTIGREGLYIHPKGAAAEAAMQQTQLKEWMEEEQQEEMQQTGMSFEDAHEWPRCGSVQAAELPAASTAAGQPAGLARGTGRTEMQQLVRNGGVQEGRYFWRQTAREVTISLALPAGVRGRDLRVKLSEHALRISCTNQANSSATGTRTSSGGSEKVLLEGRFPHPIEEDDDCWLWEVTERRIDWQQLQQAATQQNHEPKEAMSFEGSSGGGVFVEPKQTSLPTAFFLDLHLRKKAVLPLANVWWTCILKGEAQIDVTQLTDRRHSEKTQNFKSAWEAAHAAFKEKIKHHDTSNLACILTTADAAAAASATSDAAAAAQTSGTSK
ncbi:nuclear movement domain-containing protein [Cyclospora cayetanensis]|uniref:Nuclear movement domain-containing protein n=1 Tax=Cyclospora cayetanensis TaxID=88456 RepID=A0A1D3D865_9EIME|nr:nuclear movement domain-containing protein [Cyclospora cayetanensis]